jgi:hypothetical protein
MYCDMRANSRNSSNTSAYVSIRIRQHTSAYVTRIWECTVTCGPTHVTHVTSQYILTFSYSKIINKLMKSVASAPASERKSRDSRDSDRENLEILEILTPASEREGGREGGKGDGRRETLHELDARDFQRNLEILEILITGGGSALGYNSRERTHVAFFYFFYCVRGRIIFFFFYCVRGRISVGRVGCSSFLLRTRQNHILFFFSYEAELFSFFLLRARQNQCRACFFYCVCAHRILLASGAMAEC